MRQKKVKDKRVVKEIWEDINENYTKDVMWEYMSERFPTPNLMMNARTKFIQAYAVWCMVGYIIGLGDRHWDNIIFHLDTGAVSHVDFDCIFEKGKSLPVAELVPFRLTRNIIDVFGVLKEKGLFTKTCELVLQVIRKNKRNIIGFLSSFVNDPIIENGGQLYSSEMAKYALKVIELKLTGNDNYKELTQTVEQQVETNTVRAMNEENLKEMFIGWQPWM